MKSFIIIMAVVMIVAFSTVKADFREDLRRMDQACREESHVSEDEIKSFFKGELKDPKESLKCHIKCLMEKQGTWKNGGYDDNTAKRQLQSMPGLKEKQDEINKGIDECKNQKGSNECDTAYMITKCLFEQKSSVM